MDGEGYVGWLQDKSMLADAGTIAGQFSGIGDVWQHPFAVPNPAAAIRKASIWFTAYPISMITKPGHSFLSTLADDNLWAAFEAIGINAVHTGPVKRAGSIIGEEMTPSVDGHFDRISMQIDGTFGTDVEFRRLCQVAATHGGTVIDDIVPGHTGKGADFRLAEMNVGDYPGDLSRSRIRSVGVYTRTAFWPSAPITASPPASSSTCRPCPTGQCSPWCIGWTPAKTGHVIELLEPANCLQRHVGAPETA
jgi:trehalose synthase